MVGRIIYIREKGRGRPEPVELGGLPAIQATLYEPEGLPHWRLEWRIKKLEGALVKAGARRVILPEDFPHRGMLRELRPIDPLPFWQGIADLLTLGALRREGIKPERSRIALSAPRLCPELRQAAERLCPQVRGLLIDVPGLGADYARWLHLRFGLPVTPVAAGADVTVAFGPGGGRWGQALELHGEKPGLSGLTVEAAGLELPTDCASQLLALLWEQGALSREKLAIQ